MSYARLSRRPLLFRSFTGLEISEFNEIYTEIESRYNEHERKRLSRTKRERKVGAGRPFKLKVRERLLMLLVYYRLYITFTGSGFLFDLDQSNVCRDICMLEPLVNCVFHCQRSCINVQEGSRTTDEVERSTFQVSKHLLTLLNRRHQGQRTKEGQEELLLWHKEEAYCKDAIYGKQ